MTTELLQTKLNIPRPRPSLIARPQLMAKLQDGLSAKLTLVSAPPGFGKTTLVSSWIGQCGRPAAWLSLDTADNEVTRFLMYVTAALQQIGEGAGERVRALLQSSQPPPPETALTLLINDFSALPFQVVLVLEDYHVIRNLDIHKAIAFLLANLPSQLHLVIVSREDPPLPLHQLRSRAEMNGVYVHDLRFTAEEAGQFLWQTMNLQLDAADISLLVRRTEGWVAGLQLAALSLKDLEDPGRFVADFAGDDRHIAD